MISPINIPSFLKYFGCIIVLSCISCEDVVDIDLDSSDHPLVIDAEILWDVETSGSNQQIYLSRLTDYYENETLKVSEAEVSIYNSSGDQFLFTETEEGTYASTEFVAELGETYTLEVVVEGEVYTAEETMVSVPDINRIEQDNEGGFLGDEIEVRFFYNDPPEEENFYLTDFRVDFLPHPQYELSDDDFYNGNEMEGGFSEDELVSGDIVAIRFRGISEQFYNYMNLILESTSANPFGTPPANIRGNIVNQTHKKNYALGYFRLSQAHLFTYTVE